MLRTLYSYPMQLNSNHFKFIKILMVALISIGAAILVLNISFRSWDMFFLDWRQILLNSAPPKNSVVILDISGLKRGAPIPRLNQDDLLSLTKTISDRNPTSIIWAFSPGEIKEPSTAQFSKKLEPFQRLFLFSDTTRGNTKSFYYNSAYSNYPRHFGLLLTYDTSLDQVTRRIILYYDEAKTNPNTDFIEIPRDLKYLVRDPKSFAGTFTYADSVQAYMKIWPHNRHEIVHLSSVDELNKIELEGKTVVLGTFDTFGVMGSPSINYRKDLATVSIKNSFVMDAETIKNYLVNLSSGEYIKVPKPMVNVLWLSLWYFLITASLIFLERFNGIIMSFVWLLVFPIVGSIIYKTYSINMDFTRGIFGSFLIQYFGIPILLMRVLRKTDAEKMDMEKAQERERVKTRFVVKAAKADLSIQMAARVSHDIRSPLTALQIASSVIRGKVSADLENLISESTARLKFIADDILQKYREGKSSEKAVERSSLEVLIEELLQSYVFLYPQITFEKSFAKDLYVFIPQYSLQRVLSNLINNSVEALKDKSNSIISIKTELRDGACIICVSDNGPGVSAEVMPRLFWEKATYGKVGGTGLGLYQVRKELEVYGGKVAYVSKGQGSCFEVSLPLDLERIDFTVNVDVLILESENQVSSYICSDIDSGISIHRCTSVIEALKILEKQSTDEWTVFVDLVLASDEESGFDLIEKISTDHTGKIVLCTSLSDNKEIQALAHRYNAILISHEMLARLRLCRQRNTK